MLLRNMTVGRKQWACFWPNLFYSWSRGPAVWVPCSPSPTRRRHLFLLRARPLKKSPTCINRAWRRSRWRRHPRQRRRPRRSSSSSTSPSRSRSRFRSLPCLSSLHSQTLCVRARGAAMLNQQLQPVPCLRNSAPSLWFRQSRVMPSSRESAAGSGGSSGCGN